MNTLASIPTVASLQQQQPMATVSEEAVTSLLAGPSLAGGEPDEHLTKMKTTYKKTYFSDATKPWLKYSLWKQAATARGLKLENPTDAGVTKTGGKKIQLVVHSDLAEFEGYDIVHTILPSKFNPGEYTIAVEPYFKKSTTEVSIE